MRRRHILAGALWLLLAQPGLAYTANKIWTEQRPNGLIRVHMSYTVPSLREFRGAYAEFTNVNDARAFYNDVTSGADFFRNAAKNRGFKQNPKSPDPW